MSLFLFVSFSPAEVVTILSPWTADREPYLDKAHVVWLWFDLMNACSQGMTLTYRCTSCARGQNCTIKVYFEHFLATCFLVNTVWKIDPSQIFYLPKTWLVNSIGFKTTIVLLRLNSTDVFSSHRKGQHVWSLNLWYQTIQQTQVLSLKHFLGLSKPRHRGKKDTRAMLWTWDNMVSTWCVLRKCFCVCACICIFTSK